MKRLLVLTTLLIFSNAISMQPENPVHSEQVIQTETEKPSPSNDDQDVLYNTALNNLKYGCANAAGALAVYAATRSICSYIENRGEPKLSSYSKYFYSKTIDQAGMDKFIKDYKSWTADAPSRYSNGTTPAIIGSFGILGMAGSAVLQISCGLYQLSKYMLNKHQPSFAFITTSKTFQALKNRFWIK
jgi:hypothetical protein